jgi:hypothetical protein
MHSSIYRCFLLALAAFLPVCLSFQSVPLTLRLTLPTDTLTHAKRWSSRTIAPAPRTRTPKRVNQFVMPTIDFIEYSRQLRRTVFSHTEWRKHRDPNRLFRHIRTIGQSIIYRNIARPVRYVTYVAIFTVLYNGFLRSFSQWSAFSTMAPFLSKLPLIGFPMAPFVLSSPMLGLLLGT